MRRRMLECPRCESRFPLHRDDEGRRRVRCPDCDALVENPEFDDEDEPRRTRRAPKKSSGNKGLVIGLVVGAVVLLFCCGGPVALWQWASSPTTFPEQTED